MMDPTADSSRSPGCRFAEIPVTDIHPNRKQPRSVFDEDDMAELVHSVREIGVLQPIVVRTSTEEGGEPYELVMGERRWRAVQAAGMETIPAIVRDTTDDDLLRDALLENLHRSQLNPLEEAAAYQQLLEDFGTTHEQLADRIGRSRPQVSNTLRLLKLPPLVQRRVAASVISAGHARALLALPDAAAMERMAQKIIAEGMSVRATEEAVTLYQGPAAPAKNNIPRPGARHERLGLSCVVAFRPSGHQRQDFTRCTKGTGQHRIRERRGPEPDYGRPFTRGIRLARRLLESPACFSGGPVSHETGPF